MKRLNLVLAFIVTLSITLGPATTECSRILAVLTFPAKSHMVAFSSLTRELARRDHELVVVSAFPLSKPMANYTDIKIGSDMKELRENVKVGKFYSVQNLRFYDRALAIWSMGFAATELLFQTAEVKELLNDKRGFDLVIAEAFMNEAVYGFSDYFKAPLILFSPFGGWHWFNYYHGNPALLSYVPNGLLSYSDRMNFCERLENTLMTLFWDIGNSLYYKPRQEAIRKQFFGEGKSVWELEYSTSLSLFNNHFTLNYPKPLVPAMIEVIEVGGLHVERQTKKLPDDIQKFLDGATNGAIYFSMGSNLRGDEMPAEKRQAFVEAFSALPYRVLWKWESDDLPSKPENVKIGKWLPQQDILAHPHVNLFITHGGLLSLQEATFHGVSLVGIPVFGDQSLNMRKAVAGGFAVLLELKNITKESVLWAVNEALQPSIRQEARRRSVVYRDQPESPLERAVFWTEYVLRHKGAPHLRSAATQLYWYQVYLLDVLAAIVVFLVLILFVLKKMLSLCCGGSKNTTAKKQTIEKEKKKK